MASSCAATSWVSEPSRWVEMGDTAAAGPTCVAWRQADGGQPIVPRSPMRKAQPAPRPGCSGRRTSSRLARPADAARRSCVPASARTSSRVRRDRLLRNWVPAAACCRGSSILASAAAGGSKGRLEWRCCSSSASGVRCLLCSMRGQLGRCQRQAAGRQERRLTARRPVQCVLPKCTSDGDTAPADEDTARHLSCIEVHATTRMRAQTRQAINAALQPALRHLPLQSVLTGTQSLAAAHSCAMLACSRGVRDFQASWLPAIASASQVCTSRLQLMVVSALHINAAAAAVACHNASDAC